MPPLPDSGSLFTIELQIAVLQSLPTPVLVLSPQRRIVFANRVAETILGCIVSVHTSVDGIEGASLAYLGIDLVDGRQWDDVLDRSASEQRAKIHVLVVEDNPINQTIALANIKKLNFSVSAVWNGREAVSYVLSTSPSKPQPDIILMDVQMPEMDGYEATRVLRNLHTSSPPVSPRGTVIVEPHDPMYWMSPVENGVLPERAQELQDIPVIAMTASAIQGDREKCHDAGMDDYLSKPVEKGKLEEMLVKWSRRKRKRGVESPHNSVRV